MSGKSYVLKERFRPPSEVLNLTEPFRALIDLGVMHLSEPWLNSQVGGDGHPILIIPGFTASDRSTVVLRRFLSNLGYLPCGWKQGINFGIRHDFFEGVAPDYRESSFFIRGFSLPRFMSNPCTS